MSSRAPHKRLFLGAWLAALSLLANAALHGSWAQETPVAGGSGGSFSICLAHGGANGTAPTGTDNSSGATSDHCEFCVLPTSFAVPASNIASTTIDFRPHGDIDYGYDIRLVVSQEPDQQFDARAPPV